MTWMTWRMVGHVSGTPMLQGASTRGTAWCVWQAATGMRSGVGAGGHQAERVGIRRCTSCRTPEVCIRLVASVGGTAIHNDFPTININSHMKSYLKTYALNIYSNILTKS